MRDHALSQLSAYRLARFLHWLTAVIFMVMLVVTYFAYQFAENSGDRREVFYWHASFGVVLLYLLTFRYFGALALPTTRIEFEHRWQAVVARLNHWFLYSLMLIVPTSGFLFTLADGEGVPLFKLFSVEPGEWFLHEDLAYYGREVHIWLKWPCFVLLGFHSLGALSHWAQGLMKRRREQPQQ